MAVPRASESYSWTRGGVVSHFPVPGGPYFPPAHSVRCVGREQLRKPFYKGVKRLRCHLHSRHHDDLVKKVARVQE
uniref:Uncharacterized protein n=1 Tax=Oryza sativa subsp. japonica TaxID=39947 RepID=Q5N8A1_ORYSJ|nr:hypothetical protein [Oryza sativa Japonica Group]